MSITKEEALHRAKEALDRAQRKYDKAFADWQDEVDGILLKPAHARVLTRKQVIALARAIENEDSFRKIMELGGGPFLQSRNKDEKYNDNKETENDIIKED